LIAFGDSLPHVDREPGVPAVVGLHDHRLQFVDGDVDRAGLGARRGQSGEHGDHEQNPEHPNPPSD